ncbi:hypothetical protein [Streptomyces sp. SID10815]|uniref:hypothetical protein n=1 Tax=Streptomyces sp. SID10815 TaxID=2706027 RepID=UPI0013CA9357|nr:hypothetical protein [Streptomyces sp. SID10815]NEA49881.1 hypothetical protein [Streptomyces sp. SID10815]
MQGKTLRSRSARSFVLSTIVEKEAGPTAYGPETKPPLAEIQPQGAIGLMSRITEDLRSRYGG